MEFDKNSLLVELNIRKRELNVKQNRQQNIQKKNHKIWKKVLGQYSR